VALLGPTTRPLITAIQATWLTGGCLVMLPLPMRLGSIEAFVEQTRSRIRAADCSLVLIDEQFAAFVERAKAIRPSCPAGSGGPFLRVGAGRLEAPRRRS
jgi:fatty-acyl-CoA synthase